MNKHLIRLVALLLVPCLVADPATASELANPVYTPLQVTSVDSIYQQQAFALRARWVHSVIGWLSEGGGHRFFTATKIVFHEDIKPLWTGEAPPGTNPGAYLNLENVSPVIGTSWGFSLVELTVALSMGAGVAPALWHGNLLAWTVLGAAAVGMAVQSNSSVLKRLIAERNEVARWLDGVPPAVAVFGSARIPENDPVYQLAEAFGAALFKRGLVPRTGAGPSIMEAALKGYVKARQAAGVLQTDANKAQGVKIELEWENVRNDFVEVWIDCFDFVMRKLALHRNTLGAAALPGGFGTMDEVFEVWQRGRPLVLLEPTEGRFKGYWTQMISGFEEAWKEAGQKPPTRPFITSDPDRAAAYFVDAMPRIWKTPALDVDISNAELERGWSKLEQQGRATVAMIGRPPNGSKEYEFAYTYARELLNVGKIVRVGSRGPLVNAVVDAADYVTSLYQNVFGQLQAVLFVPPGEKMRSKEVKNFPIKVATHDASIHQVLVSKRVEAHVFFPGTTGTLNRLFDLMQLMQTHKMPRRLILLDGRSFWEAFFKPMFDLMLQTWPDVDPKTGVPKQTSLITKGDERLVEMVDSLHEAREALANNRPEADTSAGPEAGRNPKGFLVDTHPLSTILAAWFTGMFFLGPLEWRYIAGIPLPFDAHGFFAFVYAVAAAALSTWVLAQGVILLARWQNHRQTSRHPPAAAPPGQKSLQRTLVLDDRPEHRRPVRHYLEQQGYSVDEAATLSDAKALIHQSVAERRSYTRVIADLDLSHSLLKKYHTLDGLWFAIWVKRRFPSLNVTLHSSAFNGGRHTSKRFFLIRWVAKRWGFKLQGKEVIQNAAAAPESGVFLLAELQDEQAVDLLVQALMDKRHIALITQEGDHFDLDYRYQGEMGMKYQDETVTRVLHFSPRFRLRVMQGNQLVGFADIKDAGQPSVLMDYGYFPFPNKPDQSPPLSDGFWTAIEVVEPYNTLYRGVGRTLMSLSMRIARRHGAKEFLVKEPKDTIFFQRLGLDPFEYKYENPVDGYVYEHTGFRWDFNDRRPLPTVRIQRSAVAKQPAAAPPTSNGGPEGGVPYFEVTRAAIEAALAGSVDQMQWLRTFHQKNPHEFWIQVIDTLHFARETVEALLVEASATPFRKLIFRKSREILRAA